MRTRRSFFLLLCLLSASGFGLGRFTPAGEIQRIDLSSYQAYSLKDLMPAIEAAVGQIERAEKIPVVLSVGPTPPSSDQPVPAIPVEAPPIVVVPETTVPEQVEVTPTLPTPPAVVVEEPTLPAEITVRPAPRPEREAAAPPLESVPRPMPRPDRITEQAPAPEGTCDNCAEHVRMSSLRYMECGSRNNYLETELAGIKSGNTILGTLMRRGPRENAAIKASCVKAGLETVFGANSSTFVNCAPGKNTPATGKRRACVSENYFTLTHNTIDLVSRCMAPYLSPNKADQRTDLRLLLGLMAQESGLHFNAGNGSGASGMGQLTQDAIDAVNRLEMTNIRTHLAQQGGDCAKLATDLMQGRPPMRGGLTYRCDRMSLSRGNPALNLIYTMGNLKLSKRQLERSIFDDNRYKDVFAGLSTSERNRLETAIVVWSHNTGVGGMQTPLTALLNSSYRGKKRITDVNAFLAELKQAHRDYPHSVYRGKAHAIREKSGYYSAVSQRLSDIEKHAGGGSCVAL